jgi:ubiquitin C-terminal hydrolase
MDQRDDAQISERLEDLRSHFYDRCPRMLQHDVDEWLGALLDGLEGEIMSQRDPHIVAQLFEGLTTQVLRCNQCPRSQVEVLTSRVISVPIPTEPSDIATCLAQLSVPEQFDVANEWLCDDCHEPRRPWTAIFLTAPPRVLILLLKRHVRIDATHFRKLTTKITFQPHLDVRTYDPQIQRTGTFPYQLCSVAEHINGGGFACQHGHYVAWVSVGDNWYRCSDRNVRECSLSEVEKAEPYLLFYRCVGWASE